MSASYRAVALSAGRNPPWRFRLRPRRIARQESRERRHMRRRQSAFRDRSLWRAARRPGSSRLSSSSLEFSLFLSLSLATLRADKHERSAAPASKLSRLSSLAGVGEPASEPVATSAGCAPMGMVVVPRAVVVISCPEIASDRIDILVERPRDRRSGRVSIELTSKNDGNYCVS